MNNDRQGPADSAVMLARIDLKLDQLIGAEADHEARIRALESGRWPLSTANTFLSLCAVAASFFAIWR